MMRLLLTYGGSCKESEGDLETRPRSLSQENLALEQSEMMESKTFMSHNPAFSHGVGHQSVFNDDTVSEDDEIDQTVEK
jgi:hypothetical protein